MIRVPEDPESERALLATLALPGNEGQAASQLPKLRETDFLVPAHRALFKAMVKVGDGEINALTLFDALESMGLDGKVGGRGGLVEILSGDEVGRPESLVRILTGKRQQREIITLASKMARAAESGEPGILEMAGSEISRMAQSTTRGNAEPVGEFSDEALAKVLDRIQGRSTHGTKFHSWHRLNGLTHGFQPGQLIVLAARPGIGKTALALNWILGAGRNVRRSLIFSLEMGKEELWNRLVADKASVDYRAMIENRDMEAFQLFAEAKAEVDAMPLHVSDRGKITVPEITAQVDQIIAKHGSIDLVVIDYLQLLSSQEGTKTQTETIRIGEITRALKLLAKDRHVPILLLSQLNRDVEKRGNAARPQLSDLRDSGCIEQDSDLVMFIHRSMTETASELIIAKHRNGPCLTMPLTFKPEFTRYSEVERSTNENPPPPTQVDHGEWE